MNNSAEAEKWIKENGYPKVIELSPPEDICKTFAGLPKILEDFHQFAREKELSELNDEVIEGMYPKTGTLFTPSVATGMQIGAKMLRDNLKQNNLKK